MIFNRQLESFMVVADCGSLLQASHKLFITPPALSQQMNLLEESLGFKLFIRSNQGMQLTPSGEILYTRLKPILKELDLAVSQAAAAAKREENVLQIGYHAEDDIGILETVVNQFLERYPEYQISFTGMTYDSLADSVKNGTIDLAIMFNKEQIHKMGLSLFTFYEYLHSDLGAPQSPPSKERFLTLIRFARRASIIP